MGLVALLKKVGAERLDLHVATEEEVQLIHQKLLVMLNDIYDLCENKGINWSLCGGSLIGAVRHKGFIPWDDDVDIMMTRKDFMKFANAYKTELAFSGKYDFCVPGDDGYIHPIARLCTKKKYYIPILSDGKKEGIPIDIFVLENTYDNKLLSFLHGLQCKSYMFIGAAARAGACREMLLKYGSGNKRLLKEIKFWLFFAKLFSFKPVNEWWKKADQCFSKVKNHSSKMVVSPRGSKQYFGELYDRNTMCDCIDTPFENTNMKIIRNADYLLTKLYGKDYMIVPSENKIEQHVFIDLDLYDSRSSDGEKYI